jgi:acetoin utilization protein AcuB
MTYWIYSQGLPVPVRTNRLLEKQRIKPLTALTKSKRTSEMEGNSVQNLVVNNSKNTVISSVYHNISNNERQLVKNADDIMTSPVISLFGDTLFSEAWVKFQAYRFRHFPVINRDNQIIGIVSDRDMFANTGFMRKTVNAVRGAEYISQVMVHKVITASPDTCIHEICRVMFSQHIGALPIVGENHELLGLITRSDILRILIKSEAMKFWV